MRFARLQRRIGAILLALLVFSPRSAPLADADISDFESFAEDSAARALALRAEHSVRADYTYLRARLAIQTRQNTSPLEVLRIA